jgi:hypothetical protein
VIDSVDDTELALVTEAQRAAMGIPTVAETKVHLAALNAK